MIGKRVLFVSIFTHRVLSKNILVRVLVVATAIIVLQVSAQGECRAKLLRKCNAETSFCASANAGPSFCASAMQGQTSAQGECRTKLLRKCERRAKLLRKCNAGPNFCARRMQNQASAQVRTQNQASAQVRTQSQVYLSYAEPQPENSKANFLKSIKNN